MPILASNDNLMIGIEEIDVQRKQLVDLINDSFDEFAATDRIGDTGSLIAALKRHAAEHLAWEELIMGETSCPALAEHRREHDLFRRTVLSLENTPLPPAGLSVEILWFLVDWVTRHMQGTDALLRSHLLALSAAGGTGRVVSHWKKNSPRPIKLLQNLA